MAYMVKRTNKDGHVTSYQVRWRDSGLQSSESFDTEPEALFFLKVLDANGGDARKAERAILSASSDTPSFEAVAEVHLKRLTDVAVHTMHTYERMLVNHLVPVLGSLPVDQITEEDIAEWIQTMKAKGSSPKTISNVHGLLFSVIDTAIYKKYRADNPCKHTRLPKSVHTEDTLMFLTKAEFATLKGHIDPYFHPLFLFMVGTGLRFSEVTALTATDFDDDGGLFTVRVTRAWKRDDRNGRTLGTPKSRRGIRTVSFPSQLALTVAPLVQNCKSGDQVFKMKQGGEMTVQAVHNKVWRPALDSAQAAGFRKRPRLHDLRHTHASWMIAQGMDLLTLSRRMGHEKTSTTSEIYSHLMPEALNAGADMTARAMEGLFDGPALEA